MDSIKNVKNINDIINTARNFKRCNTRETILQNSIF